MAKKKETWMPHAGHFILGQMCRFRLNTHVNGYIISTVGEYVPDSDVRRIMREVRGKRDPKWITTEKGDAEEANFITLTGGVEGFGDEIGFGRKYETMVFKAKRSKYGCCPFEMKSPNDIDSNCYNKSADAYRGHLKMVRKWANK